ncbi:MAG: WHG domain-containing protein, partial [Clostridia bacterium]|nr:WHG domain-containing protein [Clostridia bacterium]
VKAARGIYDGYIDKALKSPMPFKSVGEQYIRFAVEEPKLFQLLFMHAESSFTPDGILPSIDDNYTAILKTVRDTYGLNEKKAFGLYNDMWIFSHGIASLSATGMINYSYDEVSALLTDVCTALIIKYKREEND